MCREDVWEGSRVFRLELGLGGLSWLKGEDVDLARSVSFRVPFLLLLRIETEVRMVQSSVLVPSLYPTLKQMINTKSQETEK